jgi:DNA-binding XRE family transcriptional regulator
MTGHNLAVEEDIMAQRIIKGHAALGKEIRQRRNALGLTIEDAASKAGVGTKTWSRYEAGESIRKDKSIGICKALNWHCIPGEDQEDSGNFNLNEYKKSEAWSQYLANAFGEAAAISFVIGSDILLDNVQQDLQELTSMPKGTHIGQLGASWLEGDLPPQFLMQYDYDFLFLLQTTINRFRSIASSGLQIIAHTVIEELVLYLIMENSRFLMESIVSNTEQEEDELEDSDSYYDWDSWAFSLFDDMDIVTFLFSGFYVENSSPYHYSHWQDAQFYCE